MREGLTINEIIFDITIEQRLEEREVMKISGGRVLNKREQQVWSSSNKHLLLKIYKDE